MLKVEPKTLVLTADARLLAAFAAGYGANTPVDVLEASNRVMQAVRLTESAIEDEKEKSLDGRS